MGRRGIDYDDDRVIQHQVHADYGHSGYFQHGHMLQRMIALMDKPRYQLRPLCNAISRSAAVASNPDRDPYSPC
jgi:hypothetical protein